MTAEEAEAVVKILMKCDGGCFSCVEDLMYEFEEQFPDHAELAWDRYFEAHPWRQREDP